MARVTVKRKMTRKDGKAKATVNNRTAIKSSPNNVTISKSKKVGANVKSG